MHQNATQTQQHNSFKEMNPGFWLGGNETFDTNTNRKITREFTTRNLFIIFLFLGVVSIYPVIRLREYVVQETFFAPPDYFGDSNQRQTVIVQDTSGNERFRYSRDVSQLPYRCALTGIIDNVRQVNCTRIEERDIHVEHGVMLLVPIVGVLGVLMVTIFITSRQKDKKLEQSGILLRGAIKKLEHSRTDKVKKNTGEIVSSQIKLKLEFDFTTPDGQVISRKHTYVKNGDDVFTIFNLYPSRPWVVILYHSPKNFRLL